MSAQVQALESMDFELVLARDSTGFRQGIWIKMGCYHHAICGFWKSSDLTEKLFALGNFWQKNYLDCQSFRDRHQKMWRNDIFVTNKLALLNKFSDF